MANLSVQPYGDPETVKGVIDWLNAEIVPAVNRVPGLLVQFDDRSVKPKLAINDSRLQAAENRLEALEARPSTVAPVDPALLETTIRDEVARQLSPVLDRLEGLDQEISDQALKNAEDERLKEARRIDTEQLHQSLIELGRGASIEDIADLISASPVLNDLGIAMLKDADIPVGEIKAQAIANLLKPNVSWRERITAFFRLLQTD